MKRWARTLKRDAHALYLAARDPRVPWYAKALAVAVAAYAASPIDLRFLTLSRSLGIWTNSSSFPSQSRWSSA